MLTGNLQIKNGKYYAVLNLKVNGMRKPKWIPLGLPERGNKREAEALLNHLIVEYEAHGEGRFYPKLSEKGELVYERPCSYSAAGIRQNALEHGRSQPYFAVVAGGDERNGDQFISRKRSFRDIAPKPNEAGALFADYVQAWLKMIQSTVSTATHHSYRNMVNARIDPYFRALGVTLGELTPTHLQDFYQKILDDGCKTNTVIHYHAVLHRALLNAVKKDIIGRNPADRVDKPKKNHFEPGHYSEAEMRLLFDAARGDPLETAITLAAYYGLRRSEVLGLKWDAVDFKGKTISVRHKVIETTEGGKCLIRGEDVLKTKSSVRTLPLLPVIEDLLLRRKAQQETYRTLFRSSYCTDYLDYVCVDQMGVLIRPNFVTEHFTYLLEKYGLRKIRFHDLRHTAASLLLANGVSMKQIQIWLGHATFSTTADIYAHLDVSAQQETGMVAASLYTKPEETGT